MVACRRMRLRRRDSGFRRNGSFLISPSISFLFPPPAHFHSRESGNLFPRQREIPRSGMVACRRMRLRRRDSCLRRNGRGGRNGRGDIVGNGEYCRLSHPPPLAGGGKNSRQRIFGGWRNACNHRKLATPRDRFALAPPPPQAAEGKNSFFVKKKFPFPPFLPFRRKPESLRRQPHSPKANNAMFRFAENSRCRENEIPAFAGMEDSFFRRSLLPFFHSREGGNGELRLCFGIRFGLGFKIGVGGGRGGRSWRFVPVGN